MARIPGAMSGRAGDVDLLIVLLILLLLFGGGGFYVGRPGYAGPGAGLDAVLYCLAIVVIVIVVARLLGVWI